MNVAKSEKGMRRKMSLEWRTTLGLGALTLPALLWFIIFSYIPMFGIIIAFKDFDYAKGIFGSDWSGLANFEYLFASNDAFRIIRNTICYNVAFILISTTCSVCVALMLDTIKNKYFIKFCQTSMFLPYFVSWVIVAFITQNLFSLNGLINGVINSFGGESISFYTNPKPWPVILVIAHLWKGIGYSTILYYGAILGIDSTLYEAAKIDGANGRQCITKITLPMLKPTIVILLIMSIGSIFRADFGLFYYIPNNQGPLYPVTDVIDTYIYRALRVNGDISGSSAGSFLQSVVGLVMVVAANTVAKKLDEENALF